MDSLLRAFVVYTFLLVIFRIAGKRSLAQVTTFDLVLTLIISETIQEALIDDDRSMTNGFLLVLTLVGLNILLSEVKQRSHRLERWLDGTPLVIIEEGKLHHDRMSRERVDEEDILSAAREQEGIERLDEIRYAVLERDGAVSVVPKESSGG